MSRSKTILGDVRTGRLGESTRPRRLTEGPDEERAAGIQDYPDDLAAQVEVGPQWVLAMATCGSLQQIHDQLRGKVRRAIKKKSTPSVVIVDNLSVRTVERGEHRGYDAGKKVTGCKRRVAVDTLGLIWAVVVCGADWQDHDGACLGIHQLCHVCRRLKVIISEKRWHVRWMLVRSRPLFLKHC